MSKTVWCVGIATQDLIFGMDALPNRGTKYRAQAFQAVGGGVGATAAVTVARLGGKVALLTRLGADVVGDAIEAELTDFGVDCCLARRFPGRTSPISAIMVDGAGERMVVNYQDAAMPLETGWLPREIPSKVGVVLADTRWTQGSRVMLERAKAQGCVALLDGDVPGCPPELVAAATLVAFSADGLQAVTGTGNIEAGLRRAAQMGDGLMMATDGAKGVFWLEEGALQHLPAFQVAAVDTLGAGDVFHGALALGLAEGLGLRPAIRLAVAAAAIKVTRFGGRLGVPTRCEVDTFLQSNS